MPGLTGLRRRLAGLLPADLRVRAVTRAPDGFDARFSALRRHYRYRIVTADWGVDPLRRNDVLHLPRPLDADRMHRAAQGLLGLRDFAAYCRPRPGSTTIRDLQRLDVRRTANPGEIEVLVTADAFCHSMVRSLVGVLIAVGEERSDLAAPVRLLAAGERTAAIHTAPARGLTLTGVDYPPAGQLAERATLTRAVRDDGAVHPERASEGERAVDVSSAANELGGRHT
ncbi:tRNA pseudouridine synthase A [Nakamurella sp. DB0629]|uniref:tRNA pseudouridine synthase n=2 Tax=Nakamurella aerolata TaxID=1656892 RepID=A0A849A9S6_9ACTN|nr:tRNA pseudouridine synthase A [Nakamurella aerolata]